ncbi:MAG: hypothetical protein RLZZ175_1026 [Bacteroidota bacterium]|jgi:hypothetical protein
MKLLLKTPQKALNKAFLKQRPLRADMDLFKTNLITLLNKIDEIEREENQKNHVRDFLLNTYYKNTNEVNTKGTQDLVIHNGKDNKSSVGVIIEAKRPTNKNEWISVDKPNGKAFQELVLYYLRERIEENNIDIKYLIATNINEWYIFEASYFEKTFFQNKKFVKEYEEWRDGKKVTKDTKLFYNEIAKPYIDTLQSEVECTFFNIKDFEKALKNESLKDDKNLIALLKILSPNHLLKVPFANDSNSLDKDFYLELLHIIGLKEEKEGGKKLIQRQPEGFRNEGSLLENAIAQLESHDKILILDTPSQYGSTHQERLFNVGLELVITWMNRILFLKLLEAQLLTYHKGDKKYAFLNLDKIKDYYELDKLFFSVLAKKVEERTPKINEVFGLVPYLNSSLFEPTELEQKTLFINNLDINATLPFYSSSVIIKNKKRKENLNGITYLFEFLNAYDFSSDGSGEIQEDNKKLINASVLGLIFEKINGYKDGSFFTPGFITMYMCRETIRRAVIQKFKEANYKLTESSDIETNFSELYDQIENRKEANEIINSLKICDPAVGSGHFLVSALNEIIAIKSDLKILEDKDGKSLNRYEISVENDELVVTDEDGELYEYNPNNKESQRIQETLFHQKQTIIENCLFGVDINPNSVKICRLRLWVELLKNAYYKQENKQLETLPNIDINIKCGNSLISRFGLDADIKKALKKSKWNVESYQLAVQTYRHAQSKEEKWEMERLIKDIKSDFRTEINKSDPKVKKLNEYSGLLFVHLNQKSLFKLSVKEQKDYEDRTRFLENLVKKLSNEIEEIKSNKIYENAFEWRFEFPEVLNNDGDFVGFDVIIGNPPWVSLMGKHSNIDDNNLLNYYKSIFPENTYMPNLYEYFIKTSYNLTQNNGFNCIIIPDRLGSNESLSYLRKFLIKNTTLIEIIYRWEFPEIITDTMTYLLRKANKDVYEISVKDSPNNEKSLILNSIYLENEIYEFKSYKNPKIFEIIKRLKLNSKLSDFALATSGFGGKSNLIYENRINERQINVLKGRSIQKYFVNDSFYFEFIDENITGRTRDINKLGIKPKILLRKTGIPLISAIETEGFYPEQSLYFIYNIDSRIPHLVLLSLFNSKLFNWFYVNELVTNIDSTPQLKNSDLYKFPIKLANKETKEKIETIVKEILEIKKLNSKIDTSALEKEIDQLVYELYGLTDEEIRIVEGV